MANPMIYVVPAEGVLTRDPETKARIPPEGMLVERGPMVRRHLRDETLFEANEAERKALQEAGAKLLGLEAGEKPEESALSALRADLAKLVGDTLKRAKPAKDKPAPAPAAAESKPAPDQAERTGGRNR